MELYKFRIIIISIRVAYSDVIRCSTDCDKWSCHAIHYK